MFEFCTRIIRVGINICIEITLKETYRSQTSPRWNAVIFSLRPGVYSRMRYLGLGCREEDRGGVVIWWKICSHKILTLLSRNSGTEERKRPGRKGILWNSVEKVSRKLCRLDHYKFKQHYESSFMFAKIRKQQLQSYSFHSIDHCQPLMSRYGEIRKIRTSEKGVRVRNGLLNRCDLPSQPFVDRNVHPKTLFEIAMAVLTISASFPSQSRFSATFSILLRFGGSWIPTNCEKFNADGSLMGRTNLDKSVW